MCTPTLMAEGGTFFAMLIMLTDIPNPYLQNRSSYLPASFSAFTLIAWLSTLVCKVHTLPNKNPYLPKGGLSGGFRHPDMVFNTNEFTTGGENRFPIFPYLSFLYLINRHRLQVGVPLNIK